MVYAVIDTNVLVSAIFAVHPDSATVILRVEKFALLCIYSTAFVSHENRYRS